jgi:hypothetical protein
MLSDILKNEHFLNFANLIRIPFASQTWRRQHPDAPFWALNEQFVNVTPTDVAWNREDVIKAFSDLIHEIVKADWRLDYSADDYHWFVGLLDREPIEYRPIIKMLQGYYAAEDWVSTSEAAKLTEEAESTWRNRCADGLVPGADKKGKTWLIPRSAIKPSTIQLVRAAIEGNNVGVRKIDVQPSRGVDQPGDEGPDYIEIRVCHLSSIQNQAQWEKCERAGVRIIEMLNDAGIYGFEFYNGIVHGLNH